MKELNPLGRSFTALHAGIAGGLLAACSNVST
jgi:hypothetical protein